MTQAASAVAFGLAQTVPSSSHTVPLNLREGRRTRKRKTLLSFLIDAIKAHQGGSRVPSLDAFQSPPSFDWTANLLLSADQTLIEQLRQGDRAAFAAVIEQHQRAVFGYLRARLLQATDADDMTQEVFLRFYLSQARFDSTALVRPWLLGIARNLLREHVKGMKRRKEIAWTELCLELESVMPPDALWSDDEDMIRHLPICMDGLGPSAREAIELQYRGERKLADIGKQLHRSEGAVKLLLHRARQALKDCLERRKRQAAHGT